MNLTIRQLTRIALMTALICILAPIAIPLGDLVPISLATLAVMINGALSTPYEASASVILYIILGIAGLPVFAGYLGLGFGFGVILRTRGYPVWLAPVMACTMYAGSMQYVAVDLLTGGVSLLTAAVTTLMVNARHLFYGIKKACRRYHLQAFFK